MKIIEKLNAKQDINNAGPVTISFLGDSVTQGCFECYVKNDRHIETIFDTASAYSTRVREILNFLYPRVQVNIINSGISGDNVKNGLSRLERDILPFTPDLVVVSYGLNDSMRGEEGIERYRTALDGIFKELRAKTSAEIIFLTQNYMATEVSCHLGTEEERKTAADCAEVQNSGMLAKYFDIAREVCAANGVTVCDLYKKWEAMAMGGVPVTDLLANKSNHPVREFHRYMAVKLVETMFEA